MVSPGPWKTHCGVRVTLSVKVRVGSAVSIGGRVGVLVGKMIGVSVTICEAVDEGGGLGVHVGVIVGVTGTIRFNPPHAMSSNASVDTPTNDFRKRLQGMIQIPENPQAFEREPGCDDLDHVRFLRDDRGKPTCCNHFHLTS